LRKPLLALALFIVTCSAATAHPHLFATMQTALMITPDNKVKGLRVRWNFDDTYTKFSLEGLDANGNGTYEPEEIQPLTDENIKNLLESNYFTYAKQSGVDIPQVPVTVYGQAMENEKLTLWFELPFATPVDLKTAPFEVRVYDPDFFIAFDYTPEKPPQVEGKLPDGCVMDLKPLMSDEDIEKTRTMLADKPQDWKPETPTDFGAMFAQPIVVTCR
jgi:ABC-type uncharacterized transport system substrate-binding protein